MSQMKAVVSPNTVAPIDASSPRIGGVAVHRPAVPIHEPLIRPPHQRRKKNKFGDGHECEFDRYAADGKCIHCLVEHGSCNLLNTRSRCEVCYRIAEDCTKEDSKSSYLISRLLELYKNQPSSARSGALVAERAGTRPLKVIVFSQFRASLNNTGHRLLRRFGPACVAEYFGRHRKEELHKFTHDPECFCLLLTKDGAEGLDLSFTTHMFFFEEIFDKSLERQAVARAWRMGATGQVKCETLLAGKSVEETMSQQAVNEEDEHETGRSGSTRDQQRLKSLLQSLRFVTDHHCFASKDRDESNQDAPAPTRVSPMACRKRPLSPAPSPREHTARKIRFDL